VRGIHHGVGLGGVLLGQRLDEGAREYWSAEAADAAMGGRLWEIGRIGYRVDGKSDRTAEELEILFHSRAGQFWMTFPGPANPGKSPFFRNPFGLSIRSRCSRWVESTFSKIPHR